MKRFIYLFIFLILPFTTNASSSNGTIDNVYKYARVCHNEACTVYGVLNFKPTINGSTPGATAINITDSGITGNAWGDEVGWVNFTPTGEGISIDPETGSLSGMAYANTGGWINFNPTSVSGGTTVDVTINTRGEFVGWAWLSGPYGGWIKFDCGSVDACVKTDWLPISERSSGGGSSGSRGSGVGTLAVVVPITTTAIPVENIPSIFEEEIKQQVLPAKIPNEPRTLSSEISPQEDKDVPSEDDVIDTKDDGIKSVVATNEPATLPIEEKGVEYRQVSLFNIFDKDRTSFEKPDCSVCLVIHDGKSSDGKPGILKWNFIPEIFELRISTSRLSTETNPAEDSVDLDATSVIVTSLMGYGVLRTLIFGILRLVLV